MAGDQERGGQSYSDVLKMKLGEKDGDGVRRSSSGDPGGRRLRLEPAGLVWWSRGHSRCEVRGRNRSTQQKQIAEVLCTVLRACDIPGFEVVIYLTYLGDVHAPSSECHMMAV